MVGKVFFYYLQDIFFESPMLTYTVRKNPSVWCKTESRSETKKIVLEQKVFTAHKEGNIFRVYVLYGSCLITRKSDKNYIMARLKWTMARFKIRSKPTFDNNNQNFKTCCNFYMQLGFFYFLLSYGPFKIDTGFISI